MTKPVTNPTPLAVFAGTSADNIPGLWITDGTATGTQQSPASVVRKTPTILLHSTVPFSSVLLMHRTGPLDYEWDRFGHS
jgi:hypothetical protein